jgi:hypothetical protein
MESAGLETVDFVERRRKAERRQWAVRTSPPSDLRGLRRRFDQRNRLAFNQLAVQLDDPILARRIAHAR